MQKILALSSQVACGSVGLSAIVPALQALQQSVIALPTVYLSNHPGHTHVAGQRIDPSVLADMLRAIDNNGWLADVSTVLTGYCPTAEHVRFAREAVNVIKRRSPLATYICDPIIGDSAEGVYIDAAAACAIKEELLPLADILMPNYFELAWLAGRELSGLEDVPDACRSLSAAEFVVTSVPWSESRIANLHLRQEHMIAAISDKRSDVPKGTGDFLSGVFAHDWEIGLATARTEMLIDASSARSQLAIAESASHWLNAKECDTQLLA